MTNEGKKTAVTLKDIGEMAGVSIATVSRALSFPDKVSARSHHKIEQAMLSMRYFPHTGIRKKEKNEVSTVLILVDDICSLFIADIIKGIEEVATPHGYLILVNQGFPYKNKAYSITEFILAKKIDGIFLLNEMNPFDSSEDALRNLPPIVMANGYSPAHGLPSVHIDSLTAAFDIVRYLYQIGHTRIAFIAGPEQMMQTHHWLQGYMMALQRFNISIDYNLITYSILTHEAGVQSLSALMALPVPPTAIFCQSDVTATGVLLQAKNMGVSVPDDISVVGVGNTMLAQNSYPKLTTIGPQKYQVGKQAMLLLMSLINGEEQNPQSLMLEYEFSIGKSTGPVKNIEMPPILEYKPFLPS